MECRVDRSSGNAPASADWLPQAEMLAGGLLAGAGIVRGSLSGLAMAVAGAGLLFHGYRGCDACQRRSRVLKDMHAGAQRPDPLIESSAIDEASWESFPASDPPGAY